MDFYLIFIVIMLVMVSVYLLFLSYKWHNEYLQLKKKLETQIQFAKEKLEIQKEKVLLSEALKTKLHQSRIRLDKDLLYLQKDLLKQFDSNED
jgi:hypothetical protein